jgi:hypothetical protein
VLDGGYKSPDGQAEELPSESEAQTDEERVLIKKALGNFALLVVESLEVDLWELGLTPVRRRVWKRVGGASKEEGCSWTVTELAT